MGKRFIWDGRAIGSLIFALSACIAGAQDRYSVTDVGAPGGSISSRPVRVSSGGSVIGESYPGQGTFNAWIYRNGTNSDIGVLRIDDDSARPRAINALEVVLGQSGRDGDVRGFMWSPAGGMSALDYVLPDPITNPTGIEPPQRHPGFMDVFDGVAINNGGAYVYNGFGSPQQPSTGLEITGNIAMWFNPADNPIALPYNPLYIKPLGTGDSLFARAINNLNTVVGINIAANGEPKAFRWAPPAGAQYEGQTNELNNVRRQDDTGLEVFDINDLDMVVGSTGIHIRPPFGFENFYQPTGWVFDISGDIFCEPRYYLNGLPGDSLTEPRGINNSGIVVGRSGRFESDSVSGRYFWRGVIWFPRICDPETFQIDYLGTPIPLDSFLPPNSGWQILEATSINDAGQITAVGLKDGQLRSVLLSPIRYPVNLTFAPNPAGGGTKVDATLTLDRPALPGGTVVALSSSHPAAQPPATVTVPAGETEVEFEIPTSGVSEFTGVTIGATNEGHTLNRQLTLLKTEIRDITSPAIIEGGVTTQARVRLTGWAPAGGVDVALTSSNTDILPVPATVTVPEGASFVFFDMSPPVVNQDYVVTIRGTYAGLTKSRTICVAPVIGDLRPIQVVLNPTTFAGAGTVDGFVVLDDVAPAGGQRVHLSSNNPAATVPFSVTVAEGEDTAEFTVTVTSVLTRTPVMIGADISCRHSYQQLTLNALGLQQLTLNSPITGGKTTTGTVRLNGVASSPFAVSVTSARPTLASVPAVVTVFAAQQQRVFNITTTRVTSTQNATITATARGITRTALLTVVVPFLQDVTLPVTEVVGGNSVTGTVVMSGLVNAPGALVTLRSSSVSVAQVPASITVPTDWSKRNFIITTNEVSFPVNVTITATYNGVPRTKVLRVLPDN